MPFSYKFHCKKCGHYKEFSNKEDCALEKKDHKRRGCQLLSAPHKNLEILARPELALQARAGKEIVEKEKLSRKFGYEDKNLTDEQFKKLPEGQDESNRSERSV